MINHALCIHHHIDTLRGRGVDEKVFIRIFCFTNYVLFKLPYMHTIRSDFFSANTFQDSIHDTYSRGEHMYHVSFFTATPLKIVYMIHTVAASICTMYPFFTPSPCIKILFFLRYNAHPPPPSPWAPHNLFDLKENEYQHSRCGGVYISMHEKWSGAHQCVF